MIMISFKRDKVNLLVKCGKTPDWLCFFFKEPGYYKDNDFGIRIEDVAVIVPVQTKVATERLIKKQMYWSSRVISMISCFWFYEIIKRNFFVNVFPLPQYGHNYLTFDTVSLVPYDRKLIDTSLLSSEQVRNTVWLHDSCKEYCMNPAYLEVTVKSSPFFIKRGTLKSAR